MVELKIKSCFPGRPTLDKQYGKVMEEERELLTAMTDQGLMEVIKESLDGVVAKAGLAELAAQRLIEERGLNCTTEKLLQDLLIEKYEKKQNDFKEGKKSE